MYFIVIIKNIFTDVYSWSSSILYVNIIFYKNQEDINDLKIILVVFNYFLLNLTLYFSTVLIDQFFIILYILFLLLLKHVFYEYTMIDIFLFKQIKSFKKKDLFDFGCLKTILEAKIKQSHRMIVKYLLNLNKSSNS